MLICFFGFEGVDLLLWVSLCSVDVDLPMHRIEPSPGIAPLEAGVDEEAQTIGRKNTLCGLSLKK